MNARHVTIAPIPVALRVACQATLEQRRVMYLAMRPSWQAGLAEQWRAERERAPIMAELKRELEGLREDMAKLRWGVE